MSTSPNLLRRAVPVIAWCLVFASEMAPPDRTLRITLSALALAALALNGLLHAEEGLEAGKRPWSHVPFARSHGIQGFSDDGCAAGASGW
jgi:hypothetical protein